MAKKVIRSDIRVNKYISDSGFCSRREADKMIADERVTINGELATLGSRVAEGDKVKIDGEPLHFIPMEQREYKFTILLTQHPAMLRKTVGEKGYVRYKPTDEMSFSTPPSLRATSPIFCVAKHRGGVSDSHSKAICNHLLF